MGERGLPLALAQAVAYILDRGPRTTCERYRALLTDQRRRLADLAPDLLPDSHVATVAATWALSVGRLSAPARTLLELAALLDPGGIPAAVLTADAVSTFTATPDDDLHLLRRFGLLTVDADTVRVHGLLQRAVRETTTESPAVTAADALLEVWPDVETDPGLGSALRANAAALRANADDRLWTVDDDGVHSVVLRAIESVGTIGLISDVIAAYRDLLGDCLRILGPDHRATLLVRSHLARWHGNAGDPAGAVEAFERIVADCTRVLGPSHTHTLTARGHLAGWRGEAGDPAAYRDVRVLLAEWRTFLDPGDRTVLELRDDAARWQGEAGDTTGAVRDLGALLTDQTRILGPGHPDTLHTKGNLDEAAGAG